MGPKANTGKKSLTNQPKIREYSRNLRNRNKSEPAISMLTIEEEEIQITPEELLPEDSNLQQIIQKINGVCERLDRIENYIRKPGEGILTHIANMEKKQDIHDGKILFMAKEHKSIKHDITQIKGVVQRHAVQIQEQDSKLTDLTARSMAKNLLISGIIEERNEVCKDAVITFLKQELDIDMKDTHKIKTAHRLCYRRTDNSDRAMIVKVNDELKELILSNIEHLEGRKNRKGNAFYINIQQPEARVEAKRNAKALLKKYQEKYKTAKVELRGEKVYINNEWKRPLIEPPRVDQLFFDPDEQKQMAKLQFCYTPPVEERASNFWAASCRVEDLSKARLAYKKIRQDHPAMSHISAACVAKFEDNMVSGLADDSEHGAGFRILRKIREQKQENIIIFVARKYGGEHIGGKRFEIIEGVTVKAIQQLNMFENPPPATP